jgi:hypothetical protein
MAYQHMKDHDMDPKESGAHNPYRVLVHKLTGTTIQCPRRRTAVNVWRKTQRESIEQEVKCRAATIGTRLSGMAALRDKVAKEFYGNLDAEEKAQWEAQAKEDHEAAVTAWKSETEGKFSTEPADRQRYDHMFSIVIFMSLLFLRCIYGLVNFIQPILDLVCEATGWKASFIAGGPEPAHGGRLNAIRFVSCSILVRFAHYYIYSIHSGTTAGDVKMNFGRAERLRYKDTIVPIYGQFLQKCYSKFSLWYS